MLDIAAVARLSSAPFRQHSPIWDSVAPPAQCTQTAHPGTEQHGGDVASIVKMPRGWRAFISRAGRRESRVFDTRQQAADWAAAREAEIIAGEVTGSAHTLSAAIDRYERHAVPMMRSSRSESARLAILRRSSLASITLRTLTPQHIVEWRDARLAQTRERAGTPITPGTVIREMGTLRSVLEYARLTLQWISANPARDARRPPEPPARRRLLSDAEVSALLNVWGYTGTVETVQHEAAVALLLALETGMRAGELLGLTHDRVDLDARVARLEVTKNGDQREVPLSRRAVALLSSMQGRRLKHVRAMRADGRVFHLDSATLGVLFRRACAACEPPITGARFHDSRATAITRLAPRLQPLELARMIGHRDVSELLTYYRESAASIAARLD